MRSKAKYIKPSAYALSVMIERDLIPSTGSYGTVKSNNSITDDPYEHVIGYRSYRLLIYVVLNLNEILGQSIFFWW